MTPLTEWLHQLHARQITPTQNPSCPSLHSLSLRDLLQLHKNARLQLENDLVASRFEQLDSERIACDHSCTTGRWLMGPGRERFGHLPTWLAACRAHTRYHQCARELLLAHRNGADTLTLTRLEHQLKDASSRSQLELVRLFGKPQ